MSVRWTSLLGSEANDSARDLVIGNDGLLYIVGSASGNIGDQTSKGNTDALVASFNPDGTRNWVRLLGSSQTDEAQAVTVGLNGSIYVAGQSSGEFESLTNQKGQSIFLSCLSQDGSVTWTTLFGSTSTDVAYAAATGLDGAIYVAGQTFGNFDGEVSNGNRDAFLTKFSPEGNKEWTRLYGTANWDSARDLTIGLDGSIYITGWTAGNLGGEVNAGGAEAFISRLNTDGSVAWTRLLGTSFDDFGHSITAGSDGSIYIAGWTKGNLEGAVNSGSWDAFVAKLNSDGAIDWTRLLGTSADDYAYDLATGNDGSLYVSGWTRGNLDGEANHGSWDAFITKFDEAGYKQWSQVIGSPQIDYAEAIQVHSDGAIYLTGPTAGNLSGLQNAGGGDIFLVRLFEQAGSPSSFSISPVKSAVNEGDSASFTLTTFNVPFGTALSYSISGVSAADLTDGTSSGTTYVGENGQASILVSTKLDHLTEGPETLTIEVNGESASITVLDRPPIYTINPT